MRCLLPLLLGAFLVGCGNDDQTPQARLRRAERKMTLAQTSAERFHSLGEAAKQSFILGKTDDARRYARELLAILPKHKSEVFYGNGVQDANLVLGRIAVAEGKIAEAKQYLLAAGKCPGTPTLSTFGPNVSLAKDLLEKGERDVVLEYFEECRQFWEMGGQHLDQWRDEIKAGKTPNFLANLVY
jgi:hypothetical protein